MKRQRSGSTQSNVTSSQLGDPVMPGYKKWSWLRHKKTNKKSSRRASGQYGLRALRASGAPTQMTSPGARVLNVRKPPTMRIQRTLGTALTYGFSNSTPLAAFIFDPSGNFGNTSAVGAALGIQDWASLINVFDQYKVNSITINLQYETQGALIGAVPVVVNRNYERSVTTPTMQGILQTGCPVEMAFSPENSKLTYTFTPRVNTFVDNSAVLASEGLSVVEMPWCDVNFPPQLYGFQIASSYTLAVTQFLYMEITYDISFKYSK